jgi:hypothetical protein
MPRGINLNLIPISAPQTALHAGNCTNKTLLQHLSMVTPKRHGSQPCNFRKLFGLPLSSGPPDLLARRFLDALGIGGPALTLKSAGKLTSNPNHFHPVTSLDRRIVAMWSANR